MEKTKKITARDGSLIVPKKGMEDAEEPSFWGIFFGSETAKKRKKKKAK